MSTHQTPDTQGDDNVVGAIAAASGFVCPECGGSLWEAFEGGLVHYHCHVGHVYSAESLLVGQGSSIERNLWGAVRALQEQAALLLRTSERARRSGDEGTARRLDLRAQRVAEKAEDVRDVLEDVLKVEPSHELESLDTVASE